MRRTMQAIATRSLSASAVVVSDDRPASSVNAPVSRGWRRHNSYTRDDCIRRDEEEFNLFSNASLLGRVGKVAGYVRSLANQSSCDQSLMHGCILDGHFHHE